MSIKNFVDAMNKKAILIGMKKSTFVNSHGMANPKQMTTANDMLKMTVAAFSYPAIRDIWGKANCVIYVNLKVV